MDEQEIKQEIVQTQDRVDALVVSSPDEYEEASAVVIDLSNLKKRVNEYWKEPIEKAHAAHKALTKKRGEMLKPIDDREKKLRGKISAYLTEQERARRAEQAKLDEERRLREQKERERIERQAEKAMEKGNDAKAEALIEKAENVFVAPALVEPEVAKTTRTDAGTISKKTDIRVTITDIKKVLEAVVSGKLPIGIVTISEAKLKQAVKLNGFTQLDGCVIEEVVTAQFRSA